MNRINAADREKTVAEFEAEASRIRIVAKAKQKQKVNAYKDRVLLIRERTRGLVESVDVLNRVGINSRSICLNCGYSITIPYKL
jgi:hypothetical protein